MPSAPKANKVANKGDKKTFFMIGPLKKWCRECDSNTRPTDYESVALPPELSRQHLYYAINAKKNQVVFPNRKNPLDIIR